MRRGNFLKVEGATQNNLKNLNFILPWGEFICLTGVSGSGKSSLAFDTLYAEGQRRYIETFSPYARQFLDRMPKAKVRKIEGIMPAIAIGQSNVVKTSRSTVATMTELGEYLKILFARASKLFCQSCHQEVTRETPESIYSKLRGEDTSSEVMIGFPLNTLGLKDDIAVGEFLQKEGIRRVYLEGKLIKLPRAVENLAQATAILDRLPLHPRYRKRFLDSLELSLRLGLGKVKVVFPDGREESFSTTFQCPRCDISYREPSPNLFSPNSPIGACEKCHGFGKTLELDLNSVIPNPEKSLKEEPIKPWTTAAYKEAQEDLLEFCQKKGIPTNIPFKALSPAHRRLIIEGEEDWYGIKGFFDWLERRKYKLHIRVFLSKYRHQVRCDVCKGSGLKPEALLYKFEGATLAEIYNSSIDTVYQFFSSLKSSFNKATQILLREITQRLAYLGKVGLGYLTLNRQTTTLSGGELERINLTTALGSGLVNTLFILDEPSIGLHPRDISRLIDIIYTLRNKGNTLVIIEHDPWLISSADWIIDLGPKAGDKGGKIVFQGSYQTLLKKANSLTGKYLRGEKQIAVPLAKRKPNSARVIKVVKARQFNLKNITVSFPLDLFVCVTGVSGSGKSTLVEEVLYRNLKKQKSGTFLKQVGKCEKVIGSELIRDVILVTQSPIGKTPRGNPLTYLKVFAPIRALFAETPLAKTRNYSPSTFSFNSPAGSCETCRGAGFEKVEMQFLADVFLPCPKCDGKRFKEEILEVRYRGKNIQEVLELTVKEAKSFFEGVSSLTNALSVLEEVGLHYLRLGQPLNTLSGGEAQRLKLAHYITNYQEGNILFIFDEPTTGLHLADINILIQAFQNLIRRGNSLIVVEHNLEVIKQADWCIDLGPEGGDRGGKVIAEGKPAELTQIENSYTGKFLKTYLEKKTPTSPRINKISSPPSAQVIELRGAREHNLKNINLTLPRQKLIAITGISGSGKSTLAFDILYAEGQRQYLNCVSSYARQYLKQLSRAEITSLSGLPPTVAIEQRMAPGSTRATVATLTEIYHFLRLLYARVGEEECPECQTKVRSQTKEEILNQILSTFKKETIRLIIPLVRKRKGFYKELLAWIKKKGYQEVRIDGKIYPVSSVPSLARYKEHTLELLLNPLRPSQRNELEQCVSEALALGDGEFSVLSLSSLKEEIYSTKRSCPKCSRSFSKLDPRLFSFNTKLGACPYCEGLGKVEDGEVCPECQGNRLCQRALSVKVKGFSIIELTNFSVERAAKEFPKFSFDPREEIITTPLISEITRRVKFLEKVGLAYLELSRGIDTLSTGELQRVRLAAQLSSELAGVCYILDEPTIGLHPRDSKLLLESLKLLQNKGNTVIVVEHDPWIIQQADYIIDLGPGGGRYGGEVIAEGKPQKIINNKISLTGTYLRKPLVHPFSPRRAVREHWLEIIGAAENNLKNINVKFPLGNFICVTGVSGAGKSSLVREVLYKGLRIKLGKEKLKIKPRFKEIRGGEALARVVLVDQTPIGRTPRSVPATYVGFWNEVRKLFALLPEARVRGYLPGRFSFNTRGGRCEKCQGEGKLKIEMKLLPPVYIPCSGCQGKRYNEETCSIKYKNKSIADVLEMTVEEAADFFKPFPRIAQPLNFLKEIGLDYLTLGQPSPSLSGGEAQRIKLAAELAQPKINTLYILEEPTIGLHTADVKKLIKVIQALVSRGNTVVIVEHNLDVIAEADYIIDLGPEGGARGGEVVAIGSPKEIVKHTSSSYTAQFLKNVLG